MATIISRNPFGRYDVIRETVPAEEREPCRFCGGSPGRFRYGRDHDSGRKTFYEGVFCSKGCCEAYHDVME